MPIRFSPLLSVLLLQLLIPAVAGCQVASESNKPEADTQSEHLFLFPYFQGNGESGVYLAVSRDGLNFRLANYGQPILDPPPWPGQNLTRDPSIIYHEGKYHMVWTSSWEGRVMGYASSPDLANWSNPKQITPFPQSLPKVDQPINVWAPELHVDPVIGDIFIVFSSTIPRELRDGDGSENDMDHRMYIMRTKDFKTFTPAEVLFDPGYTSIDGHLVYDDQQNDDPDDDRWLMVYKNEKRQMPGKNLWIATRDAKMQDDWRIMPQPIAGPGAAISQTSWVEGPSLVRHNDAWLLYWDTYDRGRYAVATSRDLTDWTDITDQLRMPVRHPRHGTVFKADASTIRLPMPSFTEADRLPNGDFEHATDDKPTAWRINRWSGEAVLRYFPKAGRDGGAAVAIGSTRGADAGWTVYAPIEPHTRYTLSGWIRTQSLRAGTGQGALINVSGIDGARSQVLTGDTPWTHVEVTFDSGNERNVQINCLFGGWGESTGRAWYDDITLESVE